MFYQQPFLYRSTTTHLVHVLPTTLFVQINNNSPCPCSTNNPLCTGQQQFTLSMFYQQPSLYRSTTIHLVHVLPTTLFVQVNNNSPCPCPTNNPFVQGLAIALFVQCSAAILFVQVLATILFDPVLQQQRPDLCKV
jgi:hypothetical protein